MAGAADDPVSKLDAGDGLARRHRRGDHGPVRRVVGVEATGINACPCAQGLVRGRAAERLAEAGFEDVERILDLVPLATHNQRGKGTLYVGTERQLDANDLVAIVQGSMSAPIYELLKRPDELFVVEHAHLQPRFVEDSVRLSLKAALDTLPGLSDDDFLFARQVNFETIHAHDVLAEREGTVGELRGELAPATRPTGTPRSATGSPPPDDNRRCQGLSLTTKLSGQQRLPGTVPGTCPSGRRRLGYAALRRRSERLSVPARSRAMLAR